MSKTEEHYSQLKKELYAIVVGYHHYHHYIYGRKTNIRTTSIEDGSIYRCKKKLIFK